MLNGVLLTRSVATALVQLLMPGPGVMPVVARSVGQGCLAGFVTPLLPVQGGYPMQSGHSANRPYASFQTRICF